MWSPLPCCRCCCCCCCCAPGAADPTEQSKRMSRATTAKSSGAQRGTFYEDVFVVESLDKDGQKFHNISRVHANSDAGDIHIVMDVQSELFRLKTTDKFTLALAYSLSLLDSKADEGAWSPSTEPSLLDKFDYGMHGRIYRVEGSGGQKMTVYVSHGGLLMKIVGDENVLRELELDKRVYTLLKKA